MMAQQRRRASPEEATPICRCRVLYLGSAVPHASKDGLQGIQGPLGQLYPSEGLAGAKGIDSWLSVWSNGLLLENVDEQQKKVTRFFPIEALHYCAAVRHVLVPAGGGQRQRVARFLPLDAPFARSPNIAHPPLFAAILRRTTGLKVLECHVFMCRREAPANALVRCCFHVYADAVQVRQLDGGLYGAIYGPTPTDGPAPQREWSEEEARLDLEERADDATDERPDSHQALVIDVGDGGGMPNGLPNGLPNHKVWSGERPEPAAEPDPPGSLYGIPMGGR
ncbi:uncharacterized protein LOC119098310 [Pollicipes pollicipes]|uniref:uncharacterized protein LOC119098310 n=1 Tax=Pollicipes pollicipes TaxID=41117 RepID=UPI0018854B7F|nr:uncharacterized protein LOC119098310 [Pollicipes pollicipes]